MHLLLLLLQVIQLLMRSFIRLLLSDDSSIHRMLDTVMTVQAAHDQLLVDVLTELQALHAEMASFIRSPPPPPFDDE